MRTVSRLTFLEPVLLSELPATDIPHQLIISLSLSNHGEGQHAWEPDNNCSYTEPNSRPGKHIGAH